MQHRALNSKNGFTLIELIVVIAILSILAMIAVPRLAGYIESARQTNDKQFAAELANAAAIYLAGQEDIEQVTVSGIGANTISSDDLIAALSDGGVLAHTYSSVIDLDQGLTSSEYKGGIPGAFTITYSGNTVTVVITGQTPSLTYTIVK